VSAQKIENKKALRVAQGFLYQGQLSINSENA